MRLLLLLFSLFFNSCHAYRYLMIAANIGYSHLEFNGHLADILVEAGHEVDFVVLKRNTFVSGNGSRLANVTHYTPKSLEKLNKLTMSIPFYTDVFQNEVDLFERSNMKILQKLTSYACHGN
ncbi:UDP-glucuronosyltransferase [Aphelenchoides bicaudatus]|nr:UDP-glucuronosyltransferase [Aphelenchoides bicaudatus]